MIVSTMMKKYFGMKYQIVLTICLLIELVVGTFWFYRGYLNHQITLADVGVLASVLAYAKGLVFVYSPEYDRFEGLKILDGMFSAIGLPMITLMMLTPWMSSNHEFIIPCLIGLGYLGMRIWVMIESHEGSNSDKDASDPDYTIW